MRGYSFRRGTFLWGAVFFSLLPLSFLSLSSLSYAETVWIDVRTSVEYSLDSIEGDVRISHGDIVQEASQLFPNKDTEIRLYCRSGGRAGVALSSLKKAGYSNVSNAGGIEDARKERGLSQ
ncbi:MAG: sulfurtransferase [Moraxellaceae bacterium]|nr:MAG: sulfurtransferase [Moraxellaceae bacterium]